MKKGMLALVATAVVGIGFAGCGVEEMVGDDASYGGLDVQVSAVTAPGENFSFLDDVEKVDVVLTPMDPVDGRQTVQFTLTRDGTTATWQGSRPYLATGPYTAVALVQMKSGVSPSTVASEAAIVDVEENETVVLALFVNQQRDGEWVAPFFSSLSWLRFPIPTGLLTTIAVNVGGGSGPYTLSSRNWGGVDPKYHWTTDSVVPATFLASERGYINMKAPDWASDQGFVLVVTDADGNVAELSIPFVATAHGTMEASVSFNFAPVLDGKIRTLNDNEGTWVYGTLKATNPNAATADIDWKLSSSNCNGVFAPATSYTPSATDTEKLGTFESTASGATQQVGFLFQMDRLTSRPATCQLKVEASIASPDGGAARTTYFVTLHTDLLQ